VPAQGRRVSETLRKKAYKKGGQKVAHGEGGGWGQEPTGSEESGTSRERVQGKRVKGSPKVYRVSIRCGRGIDCGGGAGVPKGLKLEGGGNATKIGTAKIARCNLENWSRGEFWGGTRWRIKRKKPDIHKSLDSCRK